MEQIITNPTASYFNDVVSRGARADAVRSDAWSEAKPNDCHANCEKFVLSTEGVSVVRGWLVSNGYWLMPHSVVRVSSGELVDITPLEIQLPFVEHVGSEEDFQVVRQGRDGGWFHNPEE